MPEQTNFAGPGHWVTGRNPSASDIRFPSTNLITGVNTPRKTTTSINPPSQSTSGRGTLFQFSRRALYFFGALLLVPWAVVVFVLVRAPRPLPTAAPVSAANGSAYDEYVHPCRPGPWGELQYTRILIEPPDDYIQSSDLEPDALRWVFKGYTRETLAALWHEAGLSPAQIAELEAPASLETTPEAIVIKPAHPLVLALNREARARIYQALAAFPENPDQNEPFRFRADAIDEWFDHSDLSPDIVADVKRLIYIRGHSALFSDHDVVLPLLPNRAARIQFMTTLSRKSTLLVKLRLTPRSDIEALTAYWGRGPRAKDVGPLLRSMSHRPNGTTLDVAHLLPRFARARLYTYPEPSDHPDDLNHDCHWTSLNFFNDPPDERFADGAVVKRTLEQDYMPIVGRPMFGDVFVLTQPDGTVIHSCVYIADDIVFTKNGYSFSMPWVLMNLSDVVAYYQAGPPLSVRAFRRKDL